MNKKFLTLILLLTGKYLFVSFQELVEKMRLFITKQTTKFRTTIPAEERLAIILRYLATGDTYQSLMYQFRIHRTTISQIIQEVCSAIYKALQPDYMKLPSSPQE